MEVIRLTEDDIHPVPVWARSDWCKAFHIAYHDQLNVCRHLINPRTLQVEEELE